MEIPNEGQSFYHRFRGLFLRDGSGRLLHCTRPTSGDSRAIMVAGGPEISATEDFFVRLIMEQAELCVHTRPIQQPSSPDSSTKQIVDLFDSFLRYHGKDDKWAHIGREYFAERVQHFTAQGAAVEFCLPAFPCKSSNRDKVTGPDPDRGEEIALERLHDFVEAVEKVYEPGVKLWIISDGHVFSDCIGVDDAAVDAYGEKLRAMNHEIGLRRGNPHRVRFKSLVDLFQLAVVEPHMGLSGLARRLDVPDIEHHIDTQVTQEAELCRRILMAGCGPKRSAVRAKIESRDGTITALYRGFSRFMLEDLEHLPHAQMMSKSQQKKLSAKVAFEMILRNQAYSNLVEMLFPNHIRLSIHAHNNAGPKFGIHLFDPTRVRAVRTLSPRGELMASLDLLHIPTPWHNSVVQLADSGVILVTKAKLARAALATGRMTGGLVKTEQGRAFFELQRHTMPTPTLELAVALESATEANSRSSKGTKEDTDGGGDGDVTMAVTAAGMVEMTDKAVPERRAILSEKSDAVTRQANTGSLSTVTVVPEASKHDGWLGRLRWILSLLWPGARLLNALNLTQPAQN
ncbi:hypothetical protein VTK26DRAFT_5873 [Humicola hyalothermophila]